MRVKVYNGTAQNDGDTLCGTCRHSTIIRGRRLEEEIVQCESATLRPVVITFKVTSCSAYSDERLPSYMQMMQDAWILQPQSRRRPAGFIRASDLRDQERYAVMQEMEDPFDE